jgi:hypothetical protein
LPGDFTDFTQGINNAGTVGDQAFRNAVEKKISDRFFGVVRCCEPFCKAGSLEFGNVVILDD